MNRLRPIITITLFFSAGPGDMIAQNRADSAPPNLTFANTVQQFLDKYCIRCHGGDDPEANIRLDRFPATYAVFGDTATWTKVTHALDHGIMPPENEEQPALELRREITTWINGQLDEINCQPGNLAGPPILRRLSRQEFRNTIRDLLAVDFPIDDFPSDDVVHGFDNMADVLSVSPIHFEKYLTAAESIAANAVVARPEPPEMNLTWHRLMVHCKEEEDPERRSQCAREIVRRLAPRAYRRPVTDAELAPLLRLVRETLDEGESVEAAIRVAIQAMLVSPHFLLRIESTSIESEHDESRLVGDYELASRLSYFLWSSMPDDELFRLAGDAKLRDAKVLRQQAARMLRDDKSESLVDNFAVQWLTIGRLAHAEPDPHMFPEFDESLRAAMLEESKRFFSYILREDRSILEFLHADYTFLNKRLATHYGVPDVHNSQWRRVTLTDNRRGGLLTQASILTITSNPTRTSPVQRGKWILDNLLDMPPPDPPADVEVLRENKSLKDRRTLRQLLETHRVRTECAVCHRQMDPLGFALENFDAIGAWREFDHGLAIDASADLPDGSSFKGPAELRELLTSHRRMTFCRCLVKKLLTYSLGRGLQENDECAVDDIVESVRENDFRFASVIEGIIRSPPFRMISVSDRD